MVRPWIPLALVFFVLGVAIAYFILPFAMGFLLGFTDDVMVANLAAGPYFDFVTTMFLVFGLIMEFPILLFGLSRVGIVTSARLSAGRRTVDPRDRDLRRGDHTGRGPRQPHRAGVTMYLLFEGTSSSSGGAASEARRRGDGPRTSSRLSDDQQVVVLTGLSGGGKTAAAKLFEDLGYVVVDNLPGELLRDLADLVATEPVRYRPHGHRARRPHRRRAARVRRHAWRARGPRHPAGDHLPRGPRRRPHPALLARPATATRSADERGIAASIAARAGDAGLRAGPGRRRARHQRPRRCASCGSGSSPASATSRARIAWRSSSSASASSTACRSRRTSCWTSGS